MPVVIRTRITYTAPAEVSARRLSRHVKAALMETGARWHHRMYGRHFEPFAPAKYGYAARSRSYREAKRAGLAPSGEDRPIVWTGRTEEDSTRAARVTGTSKHVRVHLTVPWYVTANIRRRVDVAAELVAWSRDEGNHLARYLDARLQARLAADEGQLITIAV